MNLNESSHKFDYALFVDVLVVKLEVLVVKLTHMTQESLNFHFSIQAYHYENLPMQYIGMFIVYPAVKIHWKKFTVFNIFAQNIDCGYTLELPRRSKI